MNTWKVNDSVALIVFDLIFDFCSSSAVPRPSQMPRLVPVDARCTVDGGDVSGQELVWNRFQVQGTGKLLSQGGDFKGFAIGDARYNSMQPSAWRTENTHCH